MTVGVLALQGAFLEHEQMLSRLGADSFEIRQKRDLDRPMDGLIIPGGEAAVRRFNGRGKVYRITFDGTTSDQPVVAGMVLACGEPVNIWYADTRDIDGKAYGHMLIQLPENEVVAGRMLSYLESQHITYAEEEV